MHDRSDSAVRHDTAHAAHTTEGVMLTLTATCCWGMFPLVFKTVAHIPALEVLAHRSAWSLVFVVLIMLAVGRRREIISRSLYAPRTLVAMFLSATAVAVNWGIFIWAVSHNVVLQSSLGYYISPLVSVVLGVVLLRERLGIAAWTAVGMATLGVLVMIFNFGMVPWVSLGLGVSWALYGLARKTAPVGSLPGLYLETLLLLPLALGYIFWLGFYEGTGIFGGEIIDSALLAGTGLVTALPLLLFARATRILRLSTIGLLMYIVPTAQFILAVFVFDEPFTRVHLASFALIWLGLIIYGWGTARMRAPSPAV